MDRRGFSVLFCATIVTLGPFLMRTAMSAIELTGHGKPLDALYSWPLLLMLVLQWVAAVFIFGKLVQTEEQLASWIVWMFVGGVVLYFTIPGILRLFFPVVV